MKTKFLRTYNSILSIIISLLEFRLIDLFKLRSKNFLALDYGLLPAKFQKIPKTYLKSNHNPTGNFDANELKSQSSINTIYKIIDDYLNSDEKEICLSSMKDSIQNNSKQLMYFEELNYTNCNFAQEEYINNIYKAEVIRK